MNTTIIPIAPDSRNFRMAASPDRERHHDLSEGDEGIDDEPRNDEFTDA